MINKFINWIRRNRDNIIRSMFIIPIISVVIVSINHVITWYDMGNPLSWAIYLSIAIEVAALSALAAVTVNIRKGIWPLFIIVTLIQFVGNVFYSYKEIDILSSNFLSWMELTKPLQISLS